MEGRVQRGVERCRGYRGVSRGAEGFLRVGLQRGAEGVEGYRG